MVRDPLGVCGGRDDAEFEELEARGSAAEQKLGLMFAVLLGETAMSGAKGLYVRCEILLALRAKARHVVHTDHSFHLDRPTAAAAAARCRACPPVWSAT